MCVCGVGERSPSRRTARSLATSALALDLPADAATTRVSVGRPFFDGAALGQCGGVMPAMNPRHGAGRLRRKILRGLSAFLSSMAIQTACGSSTSITRSRTASTTTLQVPTGAPPSQPPPHALPTLSRHHQPTPEPYHAATEILYTTTPPPPSTGAPRLQLCVAIWMPQSRTATQTTTPRQHHSPARRHDRSTHPFFKLKRSPSATTLPTTPTVAMHQVSKTYSHRPAPRRRKRTIPLNGGLQP